MENRYQRFLKETLRNGLLELRTNPFASQVADVPIEAFDLLTQAFRSGLTPELKIPLPHNLKDQAYIEALLAKIDILLSPGIPETVTLSNAPSLPHLIKIFEEARWVAVEQKNWQQKFDEQVTKYNQDLLFNVQEQLKKALPSLAEDKEKINIIARDVVETVQYQALPALKTPWNIKQTVQGVIEKTIRNYASEVPELETKPQRATEIAGTIAQENEDSTLGLIKSQMVAPFSPGYRARLALEKSVIANLPPEVYRQKPEVVEEINRQVLGRLSLPSLAQQPTLEDYQRELAYEIKRALSSPKAQKLIGEARLSLSDKQQEGISSTISSQVGPIARAHSQSAEATMAGVAAPAAPPAPIPPAHGGPPMPLTAPGSELETIYLSQGSPGHILTALTSPQAGESLLKWVATGGLLRAPLGFVLESIPGTPKLNYLLDIYGPYLGGIKVGFQRQLLEARKLHGYERERLRNEALTHLRIISALEKEMAKNPWLARLYEGKVLAYRIFHPIRYFQMKLLQRSLALGVGVSSLTDILSAYIKYGGYGGAYVTEAILKNFAVFGLKVVGTKIGLYEVVGAYPHQKYVFKPTHQLKLKIQEAIYKKIPQGLKDLLTKLAARLGISAASLLGGVGIALGVLGFLAKPLKKLAEALLALLTMWVLQYGTAGFLGALGGGLAGLLAGGFLGFKLGVAIGGALGGPIGALAGGIIGTVLGAFFGGFGGAFAGLGLGVLWVNLTGGGLPSVGLGGAGAAAVPSFTSYAAPTLIITGATVVPLTVVTTIVLSSAFWQPEQPSPLQSEFIRVEKQVQFSGNLGEPINYLLSISAEKTRLTNIKISDVTSFICQKDPPSVPARDFAGQIPEEILPESPLTLIYQVQTNQQFNDCFITNTVQVVADVPEEGKTGEQSFTMVSLVIGDPPIVAPRGLPLRGDVCLSGYDFGEVTADGSFHQGIDIKSDQTTVYSTFFKESKVVNVCNLPTCLSMPGGYSLTLGLGPYLIYLGHLGEPPAFSIGETIGGGAPVGIMGDTGAKSFGAHVHYVIYENGEGVNPHNFGANLPGCP